MGKESDLWQSSFVPYRTRRHLVFVEFFFWGAFIFGLAEDDGVGKYGEKKCSFHPAEPFHVSLGR